MANFNFNKVILGGRLTSDPELKTTASGVSVTSFTVAVNRRFGNKSGEDQQADFINGDDTGNFNARKDLTRAEAAVMIYRFITK